jgi:hypothetical protein
VSRVRGHGALTHATSARARSRRAVQTPYDVRGMTWPLASSASARRCEPPTGLWLPHLSASSCSALELSPASLATTGCRELPELFSTPSD